MISAFSSTCGAIAAASTELKVKIFLVRDFEPSEIETPPSTG
jgi:hypothetical protein